MPTYEIIYYYFLSYRNKPLIGEDVERIVKIAGNITKVRVPILADNILHKHSLEMDWIYIC